MGRAVEDRRILVPTAAAQLGVAPATVYAWIRRGHLPAVRRAGRVVVHLDDVLDAERDARARDRTGRATRRLTGRHLIPAAR